MRHFAFAAVLALAACHPTETKLEEAAPRVEVVVPLRGPIEEHPSPSHLRTPGVQSVDQRLERLQGQVEWMQRRLPHERP